jgi:hypothetical protein
MSKDACGEMETLLVPPFLDLSPVKKGESYHWLFPNKTTKSRQIKLDKLLLLTSAY